MSSYAYCPDCGNKYKSFADCVECRIPLLKPHKDNKQTVKGSNNQTNQITGSHNNVTNIVNPQTETQSKTVIQRQSIKPTSIAG